MTMTFHKMILTAASMLAAAFMSLPLLAGGLHAPDSAAIRALDAKLLEYFRAIEREPLQVQAQECDFIIGSVKDSSLRQIVAEKVYEHFLQSPLMGSEGVAISVFDNWFASGKIAMSDPDAYGDAKVYADFNRASLIGNPAPELSLQDASGDTVTVLPSSSGRWAVLYFYDVDCDKCAVQTILLRNLLNRRNYPIDLYAVYVGDNEPQWEKYASDHLSVTAEMTRVHHLWDPSMDSDFQRKYGVLQTPRLFLISPDGKITGRGLDAGALDQLLENVFGRRELVYGSEASAGLFDTVFGGESASPSVEQVVSLADHIAASTLQKTDTLMFRQMTGDLLYYLSSHSGEGYKEGLSHLIDKYILGEPEVWTSKDDSLKVVGMAEIMKDLLSKAAPGTRMPKFKMPATLLTGRGERQVRIRLDKLKGAPGLILFFAEGCNVCAAQKLAARRLVETDRKAKVLMVNVDVILADEPALAARLFDSFDLTVLPYIVQTDRRGTILRRYLSL